MIEKGFEEMEDSGNQITGEKTEGGGRPVDAAS